MAPFALTPADYLQADRPIKVDGIITGITPALLDRLDARHRSKVQPFVTGESIQIRREQPQPGTPKTSTLYVFDPSQLADPWRISPVGIPEALKALFYEPIVIGVTKDASAHILRIDSGEFLFRLFSSKIFAIENANR